MLTPERLRHGRVVRADDTIADSDGGIGRPWYAETLLQRMERRGELGAAERWAGDEFGRLFHLASLDPLRAANMLREAPGTSSAPEAERARRRIHSALDALGGISSPCGSCAWFVLGVGLSLNEWRRREGWGGRAIPHPTAKGILIGSLGVLAGHFRTGSP